MKNQKYPDHYFYEIKQVLEKSEELKSLCQIETLEIIKTKNNMDFPILKISLGSQSPDAPTLGFVGGVHGLERIGSQVSVAFLNTLSKLILWDENTRKALEKIRIYFIPTVNPWGIFHKRRSNQYGVDIMRNAPIEAEAPPRLLGGHFYSNKLPWYRGLELQQESLALINGIKSEVDRSSMSLVIDLHSGFGLQDQIWFPYAKTKKPFPHLAEIHSLFSLFDSTFPHHFYRIEPQALNYTTHGDLWDYLYDHYLPQKNKIFLPICLEMGSWMWVKKNPLQLFSSTGAFNPIKKHREKRILRRHYTFFDFLIRAMNSTESWLVLNEEEKHKHHKWAIERWYQKI